MGIIQAGNQDESSEDGERIWGALDALPRTFQCPLPIILHSAVRINFENLGYDLFIKTKSSFRASTCTQNRVLNPYLSLQGTARSAFILHPLTPFLSRLVSSIQPNLQCFKFLDLTQTEKTTLEPLESPCWLERSFQASKSCLSR